MTSYLFYSWENVCQIPKSDNSSLITLVCILVIFFSSRNGVALKMCKFNSKVSYLSVFPETTIVLWICSRHALYVLPISSHRILEHVFQGRDLIKLIVLMVLQRTFFSGFLLLLCDGEE